MIDRDEANLWIERMMDGEELPPEVEEFIRQTSECRDYQAALERAVSALDSIQIPEPPIGLNDKVMQYIALREEAEMQTVVRPAKPTRRSIWLDVWYAGLKLLPEVQIPRILHREAVPAFVSVCVIFFGVFIGPQVQAGKENNLLERVNTYADWMAQESDRISDGIYSKANGLIGRVTEALQLNRSGAAQNDINGSNSSYKENTDNSTLESLLHNPNRNR